VTTLIAALLLSAYPASLDARYRVELGGEPVGFARLELACGPALCRGSWESRLRAPAEAGGGTIARHIELEVARAGRAREVRLEAVADGRVRSARAFVGPVPASLAEVLLSEADDGERRCLVTRDEESGKEGAACARRRGDWLEGEVLGEPILFRAGRGEAPKEVLLPSQVMRFIEDGSASLPERAPRLFGGRVATAGKWPTRLCGVDLDPDPPSPPAGLPREYPPGASCREKTARYLRAVAARGLAGRHAIGVAFDGESLVWHEWAEVRAGGAWVAVDPSFEQAPAAGPRFTLGRYDEGDLAARAEVGRRVLACWTQGR
jgi:hypothetical protein